MKTKILAITMITFGFVVNAQKNFIKDLIVNITSPKELTDDSNNSLNVQNAYKVQLVTRGTGTQTGAEYLVWADDSIWKLRAVNLIGTTSNRPSLVVENNTVKVKTNHANNYPIRVFVKELNSLVHGVKPNIFGASYQWQREASNLFYKDGNVGIGTDKPISKLDITSGEYKTSFSGNALTFKNSGKTSYIDKRDTGNLMFRMGENYNHALVIDRKLNVGIGTTTPESKLDVNGIITAKNEVRSKSSNPAILLDETDVADKNWHMQVNDGDLKFYEVNDARSSWSQKMIIKSGTGNVGIGTTPSTSYKLHVNGNIANKVGTGGSLTLFEENADRRNRIILGADAQGAYIKSTWGNGGTSTISFRDQNNERVLNVLRGGNVGIGTKDTKGFKLGVNGKIAATEVKVATYNNWADFVFEKEYKLPTLTEVENHIKEKGHLENIPSAKEVEKNGFFLGEMDAKLLQKIEELTLYTIDQEKKLNTQNTRIEKLEKENILLKSLLERVSKLEKQVNN